jgi:hypothetical protein
VCPLNQGKCKIYLLAIKDLSDVLPKIEQINDEYNKSIYEELERVQQSMSDLQDSIKAHKAYEKYPQLRYGNWVQDDKNKLEDRIKHVNQLIDKRNDKIRKILFLSQPKKVQTDVNGNYEFSDIPFGKYTIFASYEILDKSVQWLYPLETKQKDEKIDLTNNNMLDKNIFMKNLK